MSDDEKRKTVNVLSRADRPLKLHIYQTIPDDGGGRPFQGRVLSNPGDVPDDVTLRPGNNPGIDKEFFDKWIEQNKELSLFDLFSATNEN